mmetsp:Transcript_7091/g.10442  ORF Transcript_7091/g.10442 Transcript_7091/m.10442 type:complete len:93 (-) Transcript_7091:352-630(-)
MHVFIFCKRTADVYYCDNCDMPRAFWFQRLLVYQDSNSLGYQQSRKNKANSELARNMVSTNRMAMITYLLPKMKDRLLLPEFQPLLLVCALI